MKPITIAGGGLAGLMLGIGLRQQNIPVTIYEAGRYPRHRVCGEFISGLGREALSDLGLEEKVFTAGAREAETAAFFSRRAEGRPKRLPQPALCLSRYQLDELLADEFRRAGGTLLQEQRWREPHGEGIVRATGRRTQPTLSGWRWFGLKVHARHVPMAADLEVHLLPQGYVGLCQLNDETVNICGLFRSRLAVPDLAQTWRDWLRGPQGSVLYHRLAAAEFLESTFCSVAALPIGVRPGKENLTCSVGDSISMIAPLTGNGMSMAFESASLAIGPLAAYSAGKLEWSCACQQTAQSCARRFRRRLRWSSWLQNALLRESIAGPLIQLGSRSDLLWRALFQRTR